MARSLIVLPDDAADPIVDAIANARHSLRIKMFVFSDAVVRNAVIAAKRRGVRVQVILNAARRDGRRDNEYTHKALERVGIDVRDGNSAFDLTHEKSMVVDDATAFIQSFNWAPRNLTKTRDYAVVTSSRRDVADVIEGFDADWHRHSFAPTHGTHLVWCPGPGRDRLCQFIDDTRHRLYVQNERFQDTVIIERLVRAVGVTCGGLLRADDRLFRF